MSNLLASNLGAGAVVTLSLTPAAVAGATTAAQTFSVKGLQLGDFVHLQSNIANTDGVGIVNARVSAADTLSVRFVNATAGSLTPAAGAYLLLVVRPDGTRSNAVL